MMRIGGNNEARSFRFGRADMIRAQIQTLRARIHFEPDAAPDGLADDLIEIESERLAMQQQTSRRMAQRFQMRTFERTSSRSVISSDS